MPENIYLESKEKLFKYYPSFLVKERLLAIQGRESIRAESIGV